MLRFTARNIRGNFGRESSVLIVYSLLAIASLTLFGLIHIVIEQTSRVGWLELAGALALSVNLLGVRLGWSIVFARVWLLLTILVLLMAMLVTGGIENTGIFWFFMFPVSAFFLAGKRQGIIWMVSLLAAVAIMLLLKQAAIVNLSYSFTTIRQLLISLLVVSIGIYVYQDSKEKAQRQSREVQADLQQYLDLIPTFNAKISKDGTILFANKSAKQASGLGEKLVGKNLLKVPWWQSSKAHNRVEAAFRRALEGEIVSYHEQFQVPDQGTTHTLTVLLTLVPMAESGSLKYVLLEAKDITADEEVDRAKSEFVTLASHQLRTPVSAIAWFAEMLLHGDAGKLTSEQREYVEQIYTSNERSAAMVDAMLMVSRLELNTLPVHVEPVDLAALCHKLLAYQLKSPLTGKVLQTSELYDPNVPLVPCDPALAKTILQNILSNAVKYTPTGGSITIRITPSEEQLFAGSTGSICISVQDNGYGIPKDQHKEVFGKMFRTSNIKSKDTDGTGLGLYIVKTILQQVGGRIYFESEENKGSIFTILLPNEGMKNPMADLRDTKATRGTHD